MTQDLHETDRLDQEFVREIEEAFADVPYPGDDNLIAFPDYYESERVLEVFPGKHWKEITIEMLFRYRDVVSLLSPEGLRFYLPCFMIGAMLHTCETDTLWQSVFSDLTPRESEGPRRDWFHALVNLLDARQKAVVRRYVNVFVQTETCYSDEMRERAWAFWGGITEPAKPL